MISLNNAVHQKPFFEKVAAYELPKDVTQWNEEIMNQFFDKISYLPESVGVDVVVKEIDENNGYAKGSVVVWYNKKKMNFPIIVNDYKLSPFDVFITKDGEGKHNYFNATERNVKKHLMSTDLAKVENFYDKSNSLRNVKAPGGIRPKTAVNVNDVTPELQQTLTKMSKLIDPADMKHFNHLENVLEEYPSVAAAFHETTGDLIQNIIDMKNPEGERKINDYHKEGKIVFGDALNAKKMITAIDSQLFDTNKLKPIMPPSVCELRLKCYPTMEDFMDRGDSEIGRLNATKVGKAVSGIVIDFKDKYGYDRMGIPTPEATSDSGEKVNNRESRPQIFISSDGKRYCKNSDYSRTGNCFYGNVLETKGLLEKVVERIKNNTTSDFLVFNEDNRGDGSDKLFSPQKKETSQGKDRNFNNCISCGSWDNGIMAIYGAGSAFEAMEFNGGFRRYILNDVYVFVSSDTAIVPARVASVQKVSEISSMANPALKMVTGNVKSIYLIPENTICINLKFMKEINKSDIMTPDFSVRKTFDDAAIAKVAMSLGDNGYCLSGTPLESLQKLAGFDESTNLSKDETIAALRVLGVEKTASEEAMKVLLTRHIEKTGSDVIIYGVNSDYINSDAFDGIEKKAKIRELKCKIAEQINTDLIKEASMIDDPEAVDTVLSLNFVNEENLDDFIDQTQTIKKTISKLAGMLIASRMGLKEVDEGAVKKAIDGLEDVAEGLENVKIAIGK